MNQERENKNLFTIINDKGEAIECEVVLTIDSKEYGKSYIVYTDHTMDENDNYKTYASIYDPTGNDLTLKPVETDEEWEMIESVLASAQRQIAKEQMEKKEEDE